MELSLILLCNFVCIFVLLRSTKVQMVFNKNYFNIRLIGHAICEVESDSLHECARSCMKQSGCESFDFHRNLSTCKLNDVNSLSVQPSEFVDEQGNVFLDITEWPKSIQFGCNNHTCETDQICLSTGQTHVCRDIDCGAPWISFANYNKSLTKYGDTLEVTCFPRHGILGNSTLQCQANGTWTEIPKCVTDCGVLTIAHGTATGTSTLLGTNQTIVCDEGYDIIGSSVVECLSNRTWKYSHCQIKDCGIVFIPDATLSGDTTVYGSIQSVVCDTGFDRVGPSVIECLGTGSWSSIPFCQLRVNMYYEAVL